MDFTLSGIRIVFPDEEVRTMLRKAGYTIIKRRHMSGKYDEEVAIYGKPTEKSSCLDFYDFEYAFANFVFPNLLSQLIIKQSKNNKRRSKS
jgi:hypothetical protein